ncbi:uncharacterized protein BO88DRAFT_425214 [Aspergillus vadensis CBS 113365]|uniref:NAD(P)-binding domain-containing protein n=1 Tax=Aspergillus vadensis (strain CBS 113365 / IMI 142717 / IBT 24658) TaxID=1448311 RepID=A0A319BAW0_ASPVC|nr:hypothetical protein BO88DRAFT_425214 [Aspergillus vadensis CBS 113365]PYH69529.1 hypothetical protein BO88DRAFT_425214 [Aspergillus vadensis CBS 113365]
MTSIFLIGPGLIGGETYQITALLRRESARQAFHDLGVQTVLGTLADKDVIAAQTAVSDIVVHIATTDDLPSFRGRAGRNSTWCESHRYNAEDSHKTDCIYDYNKPASIDALPASAAYRVIDLVIVRAGKTAELSCNSNLVIMILPMCLSIQLPTMVCYSIKHGYPGMTGDELAVRNQVYIKDLARGYVTLLHWLEESPAPTNGEKLSWRVLVIRFGSSARNRANRLRKIRWEARKKKTFPSLTEDGVPHILLETGEFNGYSAAVASGNFEGNKYKLCYSRGLHI